MDSDKTKWNNRYKNDKMPSNVSELLVECEGFLPSEGRALDIACGNGRNLRFLAQRGLMSEGIDISEVALEGLDAVSYTHLTLPTTLVKCRSRWSPYH